MSRDRGRWGLRVLVFLLKCFFRDPGARGSYLWTGGRLDLVVKDVCVEIIDGLVQFIVHLRGSRGMTFATDCDGNHWTARALGWFL